MLRQKEGVNFVTFAIGEDADIDLLKEWASGPPTEKLFFSSTFKDPNPAQLLQTMSQKFCASKYQQELFLFFLFLFSLFQIKFTLS